VLDPSLVRGLDYYSRTTFEFVHAELGLTICGGGRYDTLVEQLGGPPTPGIGFGAGIDRLVLAAESEGVEAEPRRTGVFIVVDGVERTPLLVLIRELRAAGIAADVDYAGRSAKGQQTQARRSGAASIVTASAEGYELRRGGVAEQLATLAELKARLLP
jgi:histidyl-tRNA synthetase